MEFLSKLLHRTKSSPPQNEPVNSILHNKEHQDSQKNQSVISPTTQEILQTISPEEEIETCKENNPRSLSEIAADKAVKFQFDPVDNKSTSTPKISKYEHHHKEILLSEESELDNSLNHIRPIYQRNLENTDKKNDSLSFLTDGLKNLGLQSSDEVTINLEVPSSPVASDFRNNLTFSDDEEQFVECQSFNDLSNRYGNNSTITKVDDSNKTVTYDSTSAQDDSHLVTATDANVTHVVQNECNTTETIQEINRTVVVELEQDQSDETDSNKTLEVVVEEAQERCDQQQEDLDIKLEVEVAEEVQEEFYNLGDLRSSFSNTAALSQHMTESQEETKSVVENGFGEVVSSSEIVKEDEEAVKEEEEAFELQEDVQQEEQPQNVSDPLSEVEVEPILILPQPVNDTSPAPPKSEQKSSVSFTEKMENNFDVQFKIPGMPPSAKPKVLEKILPTDDAQKSADVTRDEFTCGASFHFAESDFDYLQNIGTSAQSYTRGADSILLRFDPLLNKPVIHEPHLEVTKEEDEYLKDFELKLPKPQETSFKQQIPSENNSFGSSTSADAKSQNELVQLTGNDINMSVDIMKDTSTENRSSESNHIECENIKLSPHHNEDLRYKMAELENKEANLREESLMKRLSEKEKENAKMIGVVEAYEKTICELIAEKEQLVQTYEKKCADIKNESELNANHLASLEMTFSDLHAKYERLKQHARQLNDREKMLIRERQEVSDSLRQQESRYDKMKAHAMTQLEIANQTLAENTRRHEDEIKKLKAQLKKEEITQASLSEQLAQKTKENNELVKICDELINGHSSTN